MSKVRTFSVVVGAALILCTAGSALAARANQPHFNKSVLAERHLDQIGRKLRATAAAVIGLGGSFMLGATARGDFAGMQAELDIFGLNGTTLLVDIPGYAGQRVFNIYALTENPTDQVVGVVGTPTNPFLVQTSDGSGFINHPPAGGGADTPPSVFLAGIVPALNWDSFYTVGNAFSDGFSTALVVAPGTPGPNSDPWGGGPIGMNMAWTLPPTNDQGLPTPETLAGADLRVLVMRLVVQGGGGVAGQTEISGTMGLLVFDGPTGQGSEVAGSFSTAVVPAPGAMALMALAGLIGRRRRG
jgi:MYXO-CTERM domain-containing protein